MTIYPSTYRKRLYAGQTGLDGVDIAILSVLAHLAGNARADGWFTVTQKELAERTGTNRRTMIRRIPLLVATGWIDVQHTARNGHYQACAYRLRVPQSHTDHVPQSHTDHVPQSHPAGDSEAQRVRSNSREMDSPRPQAAENPSPSPNPNRTAPNRPAPQAGRPDTEPPRNTTALLDELGIRRQARRTP